MKLIVLGSSGQLGKSFKKCIDSNLFEVQYFSRHELDICQHKEIENIISLIKPDFVINASAYTKVDDAENFQDIADNVNHISLSKMAKYCYLNDATLVHFSTDYVFDGKSKIAYTELCNTNPINFYGLSKLNGEEAIKKSKCNYVIIRTSCVFSEYGKNFFKTIMRLTQKDKLRIVNDQFGAPTYAPDIALATIEIINKIKKKDVKEIYHFTGDESCNWAEFASNIFELALKQKKIDVAPIIKGIPSKDYCVLAARPKFSILDCDKIMKNYKNIKLSNWRDGIIKSLNASSFKNNKIEE